MTKQEIYEQVVRLTSELQATKVAEKIFSTAEQGDSAKVEAVFEIFKKENPDLYQKIVDFGEKYNEVIKKDILEGEIFGVAEDKEKGVFVFDTNIVNSLSLFVLICFANIDNYYLFESSAEASENFVKAFEKAGYEKMAEFVDNFSWIDWVGEYEDRYPTLYELLIAVFKGEFKDEDEEEETE